MESPAPTLSQVQAEIDKLRREDRAMLRPWILARYDVRGDRAVGFVHEQERGPDSHGSA